MVCGLCYNRVGQERKRVPEIGTVVEYMKEECLICKAPLEYLKEDMEMECELCHKKVKSKARCVNGHYVCNECHMQGIDSLIGYVWRRHFKIRRLSSIK